MCTGIGPHLETFDLQREPERISHRGVIINHKHK